MSKIIINIKNKAYEKEALKQIKAIKGVVIEVDNHIKTPSKRLKKRSFADLKGLWKNREFNENLI